MFTRSQLIGLLIALVSVTTVLVLWRVSSVEDQVPSNTGTSTEIDTENVPTKEVNFDLPAN